MSLLEVENLRIKLPSGSASVTVVDGINFSVYEGQVFGLAGDIRQRQDDVGTVDPRVCCRGAREVQGQIVYKGKDLVGLSDRELRAVRGREISMIFQYPMTSLHPMLTVV